MRRTSGEATSQLSACLTASSIFNLFMLRHLGATMDEREALKVCPSADSAPSYAARWKYIIL